MMIRVTVESGRDEIVIEGEIIGYGQTIVRDGGKIYQVPCVTMRMPGGCIRVQPLADPSRYIFARELA